MAAVLQTSPALKLATYIGGGIAVVVLINLFTANDQIPQGRDETKAVVTALPNSHVEPLNDSMSESLKAISLQQKNSDDSLDALKGDQLTNKTIQNELLSQIAELKSALDKLQGASVSGNRNYSLEDEIDNGSSSMVVNNDLESELALVEEGDGIGLPTVADKMKLPGYVIGQDPETTNEQQYEWTYSIGEDEVEKNGEGFFENIVNSASDTFDLTKEISSEKVKEYSAIQYATIDKEAILFDAMLLTELVGVVPSSSTVKTPFAFKLELGQNNLATSGVYMPHLAEIRMSGYSVGEWVGGCAQGIITSATFVFNDGTISNAKVDDSGNNSGGGDKNQGQIGYLTDDFGSPCIKGEKYSDLAEYAAITGGLSVLEGIGNGVASAQYDTQNSATQISEVFTGNLLDASLGQGFQSGANTINQIVASRYKDLRDLIVVEPQLVTVHLSAQLNVDYDPSGRKVLNENFEQELNDYYENTSALLDRD